MEPAQLFLDQTVDDLIVSDGALPAHTADEADGFHPYRSFFSKMMF